MNTLAVSSPLPGWELSPTSEAMLERLNDLHEWTMQFEQSRIDTEHVMHGGMYARTIRLEPDTLMNGSLVKLATLLIINGPCLVVVGDDEVFELEGYNVIPGCAGRKQSFVTRGKVEMTMIYPTSAQTVDQAEAEVFGETDQLMSRKDGNGNSVMVTKE